MDVVFYQSNGHVETIFIGTEELAQTWVVEAVNCNVLTEGNRTLYA